MKFTDWKIRRHLSHSGEQTRAPFPPFIWLALPIAPEQAAYLSRGPAGRTALPVGRWHASPCLAASLLFFLRCHQREMTLSLGKENTVKNSAVRVERGQYISTCKPPLGFLLPPRALLCVPTQHSNSTAVTEKRLARADTIAIGRCPRTALGTQRSRSVLCSSRFQIIFVELCACFIFPSLYV